MTDTAVSNKTEILPYSERPFFKVPLREWALPIVFMLSMSLWGLSFYPALVLVGFLIIYAARHDRHSMIIMITLVAGAYGLISESALNVKNIDIVLIVSVILAVVYVKPHAVRRSLWVLGLYAAALVILASFSIESLSVQFLTIRYYLLFIYFIIPIVCFTGEEFDMNVFFQRAIQFGFIAAVYFIIDGLLLGSNVLMPYLFNWGRDVPTFISPDIHPFTLLRQYPPGLFILFFSIYPLARFYRLRWWQWLILAIAIVITLTSTLILTFGVTFIICQGKVKQLLKWTTLGIGLVLVLFAVDSILPRPDKDKEESMLRIRSTYDQFVDLFDAADIEDISEFASGRMAQIIPKVELVNKEHKQLTGLGFLHREKTHITKYIIENEYYPDVEQAEEVATGVECVPVQIWITIGWIGLLVHIAFLWGLWLIVRRMKYSMYFLSILCCAVFMGISGWCSLLSSHGLVILGLSYSVVLLANIDKSDR